MPLKPTSLSDSDRGHLYPSKKLKFSDIDNADPQDYRKQNNKKSATAERLNDSHTDQEEHDDFEKGMAKLKMMFAEPAKGIAVHRGKMMPAFYPSSREEADKNLRHNWDLIDARKIKEEREGPKFGKTIERLLDSMVIKEKD